ncbi:zf-HC2 domain-containing protein [Candidatus Acetothermia bacterium]|jgi:hypothetical protein|nr:zf-HC2 domain-containing protein [Candidatus Acetothermia bacterium]MCI2432256.1 zf-HC2 domain-containing protein [Candidatus Acetothermia bacterium]MCI2436512.1 zf-HC2 domain-containing protein [Candidatus Acetothermia bacterium]
MTCLEIEELLEAYALAALEPEQITAIERHLKECLSCQKRADEYLEIVGLLLGSAQLVPQTKAPRSLKANVLMKIGVGRRQGTENRWFGWLRSPAWTPILTAASLLLLLAFGWLQTSRVEHLERVLEAALSPVSKARSCPLGTQLLGPAPEAPLGPDGHPPWGCIYRLPEENALVILVADVPELPPDSEIHLWFKRGEECLTGGTVKLQELGWGWLAVRRPSEFDTVLVTQEPKSSRAHCPQGPALMLATSR